MSKADSKHTPGPWSKQDCVGYFMIVGPTGQFIAGAVDAENADLVSAGTELLNAARCALGYLTGNMDGDMDLGDPREMLRAAIAKAEGRAQ